MHHVVFHTCKTAQCTFVHTCVFVQKEGNQSGAASSSTNNASELVDCDSTYVDAFMSVLHSLLTLFTAPGHGGVPAEGWVVKSMLEALDCSAPEHYECLTTMLKMLDIYLEVHSPACATFLEQNGCQKVLEAADRILKESHKFVKAAGDAPGGSGGGSGGAGSSGTPPTDLATVPARYRNFIKVRSQRSSPSTTVLSYRITVEFALLPDCRVYVVHGLRGNCQKCGKSNLLNFLCFEMKPFFG